MKRFSRHIVCIYVLCIMLWGCKKDKGNVITPQASYSYYPMNLNNEWIYAIDDVYNGADTLDVRVIGKFALSNNQPCWGVSHLDILGLYKDTSYEYISADTILIYSNQDTGSLKEKWILNNVKNNTWTGVNSADIYYMQTPVDSISAYQPTYYNLWNIRRKFVQGNYNDHEQIFFEANVGICYYSISESNGYPIRIETLHLIRYQLY